MENPGLRRHSVVPGSPATVYNPSGQPHTLEEDGPGQDPVDTYDATYRDDVMDMPPPTGVLSPDPVSASNGDAGMGPLRVGAVLDTMKPAVQAPVNTATNPVRFNQQQLNGLPQGQVPTATQQQALNEQQHQEQLARQNEITRLKTPGGVQGTETYRNAQEQINQRMQQRRAHPLHRSATTWDDSEPEVWDGDDEPSYSQREHNTQHVHARPDCQWCQDEQNEPDEDADHFGWLEEQAKRGAPPSSHHRQFGPEGLGMVYTPAGPYGMYSTRSPDNKFYHTVQWRGGDGAYAVQTMLDPSGQRWMDSKAADPAEVAAVLKRHEVAARGGDENGELGGSKWYHENADYADMVPDTTEQERGARGTTQRERAVFSSLNHPLHQAAKGWDDELHDDTDMLPFENEWGPHGQQDPHRGEGIDSFPVPESWKSEFDSYAAPIRDVNPRSSQYDTDYMRGWAASEEYGQNGDAYESGKLGPSPLERMDDANASHAAYDGYHDHAAGRPMWAFRAARRLGLEHPDQLADEHWYHPEKVASVQRRSVEDPIYPYRRPRSEDWEDTADLDNPHPEGHDPHGDTFRSEPGLDEPPDHGLMDKVFGPSTGEESPEHEQAARAHEGIFDMFQGLPSARRDVKAEDIPEELADRTHAEDIAGGVNTMLDLALGTGDKRDPETGLSQAQKAHIDKYVEGLKETHREKVKRLHDDWEARGGHATGEPRPVERFTPKYTKPQAIVPMDGNPFPELESPIYMVGKCEGCGRRLYDSEDSSGDPRGALGDHTVSTLDAAEHFPRGDRSGETRMHGPSALICPDCENDEEKYNRILDKYRGHKAGDRTGDGSWGYNPNSGKREFIPSTYLRDRKGKWHEPGEKVGGCYECDHGITGFHTRHGGPTAPDHGDPNMTREARVAGGLADWQQAVRG